MQNDTGKEQLIPRVPKIGVIGCCLVASEVALSTSSHKLDRLPGRVTIDDVVQQVPAASQIDFDLGTLTASSEKAFRYIAYYNEAVGGIFFLAVVGSEALTSVGASYPTDAQVEAALPNAEYSWTEVQRGKFARSSGTVVTVTVYDLTGRAYDVPTASKDPAAGYGSKNPLGDAVYRYFETVRHTIDAADITNADILTDLPFPLYNGKILRWRVVAEKAVTTAAKTTLPHLEIGAVAVTGTDGQAVAGLFTKGAVLALGAPTAAQTFAPGDVWSIVAASTTAFVEGRFRFEVELGRLVEPEV